MPVTDIRIVKSTLRETIKSIRAAMPPQQKQELDEIILAKVLEQREYKVNKILFTYVSKSIEVDTLKLIQQSLDRGKKVAVPRCIKEDRQMDFYFITSFDDLEPGMFGVLEPITDKCELVEDYSKGFCIVPGFSFDSEGYRLGYGKGYYDRFFSKFKGYSAGLCYTNSTRWRLPHGFYDKNVHVVITEKYVRHIHKLSGKKREDSANNE